MANISHRRLQKEMMDFKMNPPVGVSLVDGSDITK